MKLIHFLLYFNISFGFISKNKLFYRDFSIKSLLNIQPFKTIAYYKLQPEQKNKIANLINNRFIMEPITTNNESPTFYLGITLTNYLNLNKYQLFVDVKDIETNMYGQYIIESIEYKNNIRQESILCSFYYNNDYYCHFSYYRDYYDTNHNNHYYFDFIYENNTFYKNILNNTQFNNIIKKPNNVFISQLKYKNMSWYNADIILYYINSFTYTN